MNATATQTAWEPATITIQDAEVNEQAGVIVTAHHPWGQSTDYRFTLHSVGRQSCIDYVCRLYPAYDIR